MNRKFYSLMAAAFIIALGATAMATPKKSLTYKVSLGGMNAGTFSSMTIPTHSVTLAGKDVIVVANTNAPDRRAIVLNGGTISSFIQGILTPKIGEQMTITVDVVPIGAIPGKRCTFTLGHAYLLGVSEAELMLRPSSLPKVKCTGDDPPPSAP